MTETSSHTLLETQACKIPGCMRDAVASRGRFAGLCAVHIEDRRRADANGATAKTPETATLAWKVQELGKLGRNVDRLRAEAKKLTEKALEAKKALDEGERAFRQLARELMGGDDVQR